MKIVKATVLIVVGLFTAGCAGQALEAIEGGDRSGPGGRTVDAGFEDGKHLSNMVAAIWVDPNGCDHWIIDDGAEGYLSERLTPDGRPVCSGVAPPSTVVSPFNEGSENAFGL